MRTYVLLMLILLTGIGRSIAAPEAQWRGPNRDGVFPETGLLQAWPADGPELLWSAQELGKGFASVSVTNNAVYVAGLIDTIEYLTALDLDGNRQWHVPYGQGVSRSYPDTRCTPTVTKERIYLISGQGEVVCLDRQDGSTIWSVPALEKWQGAYWQWGIAESPLLVDDKVVYTVGGHQTTMVALDAGTGETVWQSKSLADTAAFVSPILVHQGSRDLIIGITIKYIFGVDAQTGDMLWTVNYAEIDPPTFHPWAPKNNCITPLYDNGMLFVTSGYDHVGVMFKLSDNGSKIEQVWKNPVLDCHHGQVVKVGDYIYGSNWLSNADGNWCCLDWNTGETRYETEWETKGPISAADGMLYCYDERKGNLALVKATPEAFEVVSSFRIREGRGPHWAQPVIRDGVLYIRHGDTLLAYNVKTGN